MDLGKNLAKKDLQITKTNPIMISYISNNNNKCNL